MQQAERLYRQRGHLAVAGFAGNTAMILQPLHKARHNAAPWITPIAGGGGTSLRSALDLAESIFHNARKKWQRLDVHLWLITDGRLHDLPEAPTWTSRSTLVNVGDPLSPANRIALLAHRWHANLIHAGKIC